MTRFFVKGHYRGDTWIEPHYRGPVEEKRKCHRCGEWYQANSSYAKYCNSCRPIVRQIRQKAFRERTKRKRTEYDRIYQARRYRELRNIPVAETNRFLFLLRDLIERRKGDTVSARRIVGYVCQELKIPRNDISAHTYEVIEEMCIAYGAYVWNPEEPPRKRVYKF